MIASPVSNDYILVDQHDVSTQPVVAHTNRRGVASRICNISRYAYRRTKIAGKYTYKTINAHPIIAISTVMVPLLLFVALTACNYQLYVNQSSTLPIVAPFTLAAGLISALMTPFILLALTAYHYKSHRHHTTTHSIIVASIVIVTLASSMALAILAAYDYGLRTNQEVDIPTSLLPIPTTK